MNRRKFFGLVGGGTAAVASGCMTEGVGGLVGAADEQSDREFVVAYLRKRVVEAAKRRPRVDDLEVERLMKGDFNVCLEIRGDNLYALNAHAIVAGE